MDLLEFIVLSLIAVPLLSLIIFIYLYVKNRSRYTKLYDRYKDVINIDAAVGTSKELLLKLKAKQDALKSDYIDKNATLANEYKEKRSFYEKLLKEISILEEESDFISYGIYKPHFDYDTSIKYKDKIKINKEKQKDLIREKEAAVCSTEWNVGGSAREGKKMTTRNIKLMLRAFNNECDSAILKVTWNNADKMEQRILKAYEAINKLGETNSITITNEYLNLRLKELYLAHEYQNKLNEEREEQKRIREQIREEEKVQRELEKAKTSAEKEENLYQKALEKAQEELQDSTKNDVASLKDKIAKLEQHLKEAHEKRERAISRAQMTRSGHVYVISNIGSFGENIYKIGMTRRLEPLDRVRELGDASVPFIFDIHAMIFSDDAPKLEKTFHQHLEERRTNLVNNRKEFFNVTLSEIEEIAQQYNGEIEFTKLAEAREYRETLSIIEQNEEKEQIKVKVEEEFPVSL